MCRINLATAASASWYHCVSARNRSDGIDLRRIRGGIEHLNLRQPFDRERRLQLYKTLRIRRFPRFGDWGDGGLVIEQSMDWISTCAIDNPKYAESSIHCLQDIYKSCTPKRF